MISLALEGQESGRTRLLFILEQQDIENIKASNGQDLPLDPLGVENVTLSLVVVADKEAATGFIEGAFGPEIGKAAKELQAQFAAMVAKRAN